jgi:hypothetical protein
MNSTVGAGRSYPTGCRRSSAPLEPARNQPRQVPTVIQVRMRQDDGVDGRGIDGQRLPVPQPKLFQPLKQAAIDQDSASVRLQQVLPVPAAPRNVSERAMRWPGGYRMPLECRVTFVDIGQSLA